MTTTRQMNILHDGLANEQRRDRDLQRAIDRLDGEITMLQEKRVRLLTNQADARVNADEWQRRIEAAEMKP